jgi:DNA excision repair protein ERCC-3
LAAVSIGLDTYDIFDGLERLCKMDLPKEVLQFIELHTKSYGKVSLVLKGDNYFLETTDEDVFHLLESDKALSDVVRQEPLEVAQAPAIVELPSDLTAEQNKEVQDILSLDLFTLFNDDFDMEDTPTDIAAAPDAPAMESETLDTRDEKPEPEQALIFSLNIDPASIETVKKRCSEMSMPLLEEYDFRKDIFNPKLDIDLKPKAKLRDYQEKGILCLM